MITFLHGKLIEALPTQVTVDVNGVGYEVLIPLSSFDRLPPPGQDVKVTVTLPADGALVFFCKYHRRRGMLGEVRAG